ncbi:hypothetical protein INR49_017193, partial [Caranx melampygus]
GGLSWTPSPTWWRGQSPAGGAAALPPSRAGAEKKAAGGGGSSEGRTRLSSASTPSTDRCPGAGAVLQPHRDPRSSDCGDFPSGSSKKRVRQLREDFDMGVDVQLDEEHSVHDHLLYVLPPCNCDTLLRLLTLLHTVQSFAQDTIGTNDEEMTAANLAVIFGPNLLQRERGGDVGIEDSTAIISVTLVLIQNHRRLFMVSAEMQQEVLMSLIQTDPDIIDYLLRRKLSSHISVEGNSSESGGRRDTGASLDSVGASSGSLSPLEPPSPLFPPDGSGSEGSLTSEVFLNVLKLNQNRRGRRPDTLLEDLDFSSCEVPPGKSIRHMRQFHSHHNLLSLAQPSSSSSSTSRLHSQDSEAQDRRGALGSALSFSLSGGVSGSCSSLSGSSESSIWVRQMPQEESKPSPTANFWDFFTGKGSGSETMV